MPTCDRRRHPRPRDRKVPRERHLPGSIAFAPQVDDIVDVGVAGDHDQRREPMRRAVRHLLKHALDGAACSSSATNYRTAVANGGSIATPPPGWRLSGSRPPPTSRAIRPVASTSRDAPTTCAAPNTVASDATPRSLRLPHVASRSHADAASEIGRQDWRTRLLRTALTTSNPTCGSRRMSPQIRRQLVADLMLDHVVGRSLPSIS